MHCAMISAVVNAVEHFFWISWIQILRVILQAYWNYVLHEVETKQKIAVLVLLKF